MYKFSDRKSISFTVEVRQEVSILKIFKSIFRFGKSLFFLYIHFDAMWLFLAYPVNSIDFFLKQCIIFYVDTNCDWAAGIPHILHCKSFPRAEKTRDDKTLSLCGMWFASPTAL